MGAEGVGWRVTGARAGAFPELGHPELLAISGESHVEAALGGWGGGGRSGAQNSVHLHAHACELLPQAPSARLLQDECP